MMLLHCQQGEKEGNGILIQQRCLNSLVARGHDTGDRLQIDLLGDVAGLDDLLLAGEAHQPVLPHLPTILISPQLHIDNNNTYQSIG
jgi:hypothetical protein